MDIDRKRALLLACAFAAVSLQAEAGDRIHAGQWTGTWTGGGRTRNTSECITQADAAALNGDATTIRAYLEKIIPASICKVSNIKVNGPQVVYTSVCNGKENVITTNYHGDSFETSDSGGAKSAAKRVGAC